MRIDCPKAAQAPAWLPATPRPGQVQTPQVSHLGISRSGRRGDAQDLRAASRSGHLGGFASGRTRGGHPDIRHKSTATPAAPPAGAARAGSGRRSASCRDCLRSSPVADRTHVSLPTPHSPLTPSGECREPSARLATARSLPQDRGALKHRWARPVLTERARARKFTQPRPAAAAARAPGARPQAQVERPRMRCGEELSRGRAPS